jgi:hypothetical protein
MAPDCTSSICPIFLQLLGCLRRPLRIEHEAKAECAKIEMKVVFMLKQSRNLLLMTGGYESRFGEYVFKILDYIVTFDMDRAIVNEHRSQSTRIDAQKPRLDVLVGQ